MRTVEELPGTYSKVREDKPAPRKPWNRLADTLLDFQNWRSRLLDREEWHNVFGRPRAAIEEPVKNVKWNLRMYRVGNLTCHCDLVCRKTQRKAKPLNIFLSLLAVPFNHGKYLVGSWRPLNFKCYILKRLTMYIGNELRILNRIRWIILK